MTSERIGFLLDLGRCVGCGACVLACRLENELPEGIPWRRVLSLNGRRDPSGPTYHFSVACHHCEKPACLTACPAAAYEKREDGVVLLHQDQCIGCRYCEMACPFGAPSYNPGLGVMSKCHLCSHRLDEERRPACVDACPTEALRLDAIPGDATVGDRSVPGDREVTSGIPGFADPAECEPGIRFVTPGGARRAKRLERLRQVL